MSPSATRTRQASSGRCHRRASPQTGNQWISSARSHHRTGLTEGYLGRSSRHNRRRRASSLTHCAQVAYSKVECRFLTRSYGISTRSTGQSMRRSQSSGSRIRTFKLISLSKGWRRIGSNQRIATISWEIRMYLVGQSYRMEVEQIWWLAQSTLNERRSSRMVNLSRRPSLQASISYRWEPPSKERERVDKTIASRQTSTQLRMWRLRSYQTTAE